MIVLQSTDGSLVRKLHRANHKVKILLYQDALLSSVNDPHGFTTCTQNVQGALVSNPGWFVRDLLGRPIGSGLYQGYYVMNVASPTYEAACVGHAIAQAEQSGFDGIFMDGVTAWAGWTFPPGVTAPLFPTPAVWQQAMTPFVSYLGSQAHAHGLLAFANIGGARIAPGLWQRWTSLLDGSEEESWTDGGQGLADQILDWPAKLANVAWSEAHHKYALLHSYDTTAAGNEYGLASMLLVARGYSSYCTSNRSYAKPGVWRGVYVTAERLGAPAGAYRRLGNGVYVRRFAHGIVLVNPTAGSVARFSLSGRYELADRAVRSATMAPTSGLILLKAH
ncbi:MAG: putative glycoside hydrolase family 15 protein [Actinomycetota bacterium]|nr:putative glycoside hydrolase family 15 protein [Actinomycetota bacterium]